MMHTMYYLYKILSYIQGIILLFTSFGSINNFCIATNNKTKQIHVNKYFIVLYTKVD